VSATLQLFGGLTGTTRTATLQDPLPELTWGYEIDAAARTVTFTANDSDHRIPLPLEPMLGTVGAAPERGEVRSTAVPDTFGGNMDTPSCGPGPPATSA